MESEDFASDDTEKMRGIDKYEINDVKQTINIRPKKTKREK